MGWTQWHVLNVLVNQGPTMQRDLGVLLEIERPTMSGVVTALVRKGFVDQSPSATDQRQRILHLTDTGKALWESLPNPIEIVLTIAFEDADDADLAIARRVLRDATHRIVHYQEKGTNL
nr:MarR family transcriptional regulator [Rhodococcus sp. B10]